MDAMLEVALRGVLPPMLAVLLLVLPFGRRWLGLAAGLGFAAAFMLLKHEWLQLPQQLWLGNQDAMQWLCWCLLAAALVSCLPAARAPRGLAVPLAAAVVLATAWLPLANLRRGWSPAETALHTGIALLLLGASALTFGALPARRPGPLPAVLLIVCLSVDALVLVAAASSALQAQLAGALAAALGTSLGLWLWRRPFELLPASTLPLAIGHAGLLLLGHHLSYSPEPLALLAAALAPLGLWLRELPALRQRPVAGLCLWLGSTFALLGFAVGWALATMPEPSGY